MLLKSFKLRVFNFFKLAIVQGLKVQMSIISTNSVFRYQQKWVDLKVSPAELRPDLSLQMGQCFNWFRIPAVANEIMETPSKLEETANKRKRPWIGILGDHVFSVRQTHSSVEYSLLNSDHLGSLSSDDSKNSNILHNYFQTDDSL